MEGLLARLALTPVETATRKGPPIAWVYGAFGLATVTLTAIAFALQDWERSKWAIYALTALVIVWSIVAFAWALPQAFKFAGRMMEPVGLRVVGTPTYVPNMISGGGQLEGAVSYAGERHGRQVDISQSLKEALTVVTRAGGGWGAPIRGPSSPAEMAMLTGEPAGTWKDVTVEVGPAHVAVRRRCNGAGAWMLHDLLLAETLAAGR
jgi:hypothetical protein